MREADFTRKIHRLLIGVHAWKISDPYHRGVLDAWYSGTQRDLWAEYKFLPKVPTRRYTPKLSPFQREWLIERHNEGRRVAVIVGTPKFAQFLPGLEGIEAVAPDFSLTHQALARCIEHYVNH